MRGNLLRTVATVLLVLLAAACVAPPAPPTETDTVEEASPEATEPATVAPTSPPTSTRAEIVLPPTVTATPTFTPSPSDTPTPEPERARIAGGGGQGVNMRREPGTSFPVVKSVQDGTEVTIVGPDREVEGRLWRNVQDGDAVGWVVATALRPAPTPTATPSSVPTTAATAPSSPAPNGSATPTPAPTGTPAPPVTTPSPTPTTAATAAPERVEVFGTGGQGANLRAEPGPGGRLLQTVPDGTRLTIVGPDREVDGRPWRNVRGDAGTTGWLIGETVRPVETATATPAATSTAPAATSTPQPTGTPTVAASSTGTATPPPAPTPAAESENNDNGEPSAGEPTPAPERVEVFGTDPQGANLRARPARSGAVLRSIPDGTQLTIIGDDEIADGVRWRHVQAEDGVQGWLAQEVVRTVVIPTPTPRPGSAGIGVPIPALEQPEEEFSEAQRAATPCRPGQLKGDAATGLYYQPEHPQYAELRQRVRCFDGRARAEASGFLPAPPPEDEAGE